MIGDRTGCEVAVGAVRVHPVGDTIAIAESRHAFCGAPEPQFAKRLPMNGSPSGASSLRRVRYAFRTENGAVQVRLFVPGS